LYCVLNLESPLREVPLYMPYSNNFWYFWHRGCNKDGHGDGFWWNYNQCNFGLPKCSQEDSEGHWLWRFQYR